MAIILFNGIIRTLHSSIPQVEAIRISNGLIKEVGTSEELLNLAEKDTTLINLHNKLVLPGFTDSHMHLMHYSIGKQEIELSAVNSIDNLISTLQSALAGGWKYNEWILGSGWNQDNWDNPEMPTRFDLDKISRDIPIALTRVCHHMVVVNSKALELMGLFENIPDMARGLVVLDENGVPNGILRENAQNLVRQTIKSPASTELKEMILSAGKDLLKQGITAVYTDDFSAFPTATPAEFIEAYQELARADELPLRVVHQCLMADVHNLQRFLDQGYRSGQKTGLYQIGPIKLLLDGSLGARSACMRKPYLDQPDSSGTLLYSDEALQEIIDLAHRHDMQIAIHCIGDGAVEAAVDCFEKVSGFYPIRDHRHGIVHCQFTDKNLLRRIAEQKLLTYVQPIFTHADWHIAENRVGREVVAESYDWRGMVDRGIHMSGGSDCPVEPFDILPNIYCAVTRKDLNGNPQNGWFPENAINIEEAVRAFTVEGAYAAFQEKERGLLMPGYAADLVVLEKDIYHIDPEEIKDVQIELTMVNGTVRYRR